MPSGRSREVSASPAIRPVPVPSSPAATLNPSPPDDRRKVTSSRGPARGWRRPGLFLGRDPRPQARGSVRELAAVRPLAAVHQVVHLLTHRAHASSERQAAPDGGRAQCQGQAAPPVSFLPAQAGSSHPPVAYRQHGLPVSPWSGGTGSTTAPASPLLNCDIHCRRGAVAGPAGDWPWPALRYAAPRRLACLPAGPAVIGRRRCAAQLLPSDSASGAAGITVHVGGCILAGAADP
jgi:hypothetical protein